MDTEKELLFCKDCKHARRKIFDAGEDLFSFSWDHARCVKTERRSINIVTGKVTVTDKASRCSYTCELSSQCGRDGKWWEPKNTKKHLFTLLKQ